jgi:hypothetical protein
MRTRGRRKRTHPSFEVTRTQDPPRIVVGQLVNAFDALDREDLPSLVAVDLSDEICAGAAETQGVTVCPRTDEKTIRDGDGASLKRCFVRVRDGAALLQAN